MKTVHLRRISRLKRGSSLLELVIALTIGAVTVTLCAWLAFTFFGSRYSRQSAFVGIRQEIDEMALGFLKENRDATRAFVFAGELKTADGQSYLAQPLTLSSPLYSLNTGIDFMNSAGLVLSPGDCTTVIVIGSRISVFVLRNVSLPDGWMSVSLAIIGQNGVRQIRFGAPPGLTSQQMTALKGDAGVLADGSVYVDLPNPLAQPSLHLPGAEAGSRIVIRQKVPVSRS